MYFSLLRLLIHINIYTYEDDMNTEEQTEKLNRFMEAYAMMRKFQKDYFKHRMIPDLQKAKVWEKEADRLHAELTKAEKLPDAVQDVLL